MSKKLLNPDYERRGNVKRYEFEQGEGVFCKHLGLWARGTFVCYNKDGSLRVRLTAKERVDLKSWDVAPTRKDGRN